MLTPILRLGLDPDGLGAVLDEGADGQVAGRLSRTELSTLPERLARLLAPPERLLTSAAEADTHRRELHAARALATLLSGRGMSPIRGRIAALRTAAEQRGAHLCLLFDPRTHALERVPWELVTLLTPGDWVAAGARVVRTSGAAVPALPRHGERLQVTLWTPRPEDPICLAVLDPLLARLTALDVEVLRPASLDGLHLGTAGIYPVVHVLTQHEDDLATLPPSLGAGAGLVVLDICGSARGSRVPTAEIGPLHAPAVLRPATRLAHDASTRFSLGLYESLADGGSLVDAVAEGRRRLERLGVAHPTCRWWNPRLRVSGRHVLDAPPPLRGADRPTGWPAERTSAGGLLSRANEQARARGWFGVEQLLGALLSMETPTARLRTVRPPLVELMRTLPPLMGVGGEPTPTPRVRALGALLEAGWGPDDLLRVLLDVPWVRAELFAPVLGEPSRGPSGDAARALLLEVWGGPEDGRQLRLEPGAILGRTDPARRGDAVELYPSGGPVDLALSRRALVATGGSHVQLPAAARLQRGREALRSVQGHVEVRAGDVLWLGQATRLAVLATG